MAEAKSAAIKVPEIVDMPTPATAQKAVAVPPALMQEVLEVLTAELPMKRVRGIVQMLEQCPIMDIGVTK